MLSDGLDTIRAVSERIADPSSARVDGAVASLPATEPATIAASRSPAYLFDHNQLSSSSSSTLKPTLLTVPPPSKGLLRLNGFDLERRPAEGGTSNGDDANDDTSVPLPFLLLAWSPLTSYTNRLTHFLGPADSSSSARAVPSTASSRKQRSNPASTRTAAMAPSHSRPVPGPHPRRMAPAFQEISSHPLPRSGSLFRPHRRRFAQLLESPACRSSSKR
jgi:hypothetical protein